MGLQVKKPVKFIRREEKGKSFRIQFNNKKFVDKLISMGLPKGKKTFGILIPSNLLKKEIMPSILRALFEADGCLYFSKSKKLKPPSYPRIEIRSFSISLVNQLRKFLETEGSIVYIKSGKTFFLIISGKKMLNLWINKTGFVSFKNTTKYKI